MIVFTIGFTKTTAEHFFGRLRQAGVTRVIDVRLNNVSQLAGFAKREDLRYFLDAICGVGYEHRTELAPTQPMLDAYRGARGGWPAYERAFVKLLAKRRIEEVMQRGELDGACLLCSEREPHHCHRRLVAEYLQRRWGGTIAHL